MAIWDFFRKKKLPTKHTKSVRYLDVEGFPTLDTEAISGGTDIKIPKQFLSVREVNQIFESSDILQLVTREVNQEVFRNGLDVFPYYDYKCSACGKEYEEELAYCEECGATLKEPNYNDQQILEDWVHRRNSYGQTILQTMKEVDMDVEKHDNGFVFLSKVYNFDDDNRLRAVQIDEVLRASVSWTRKLYSKYGIGRDDEGNHLWTCVAHRDNLEREHDGNTRPRCRDCSREMFPAHYVDISQGGRKYFVKGEIYHLMKFEPSSSYGRSRILAIWLKVMTLVHQDRYMYQLFVLQRSPRGLLFVRGRLETIKKAWAWLKNMARLNPHMLFPLALDMPPGREATGKMVEYVDLSIDLKIMQFIETREEFRRLVGMAWGVAPIYQGDMSSGGGLNNEGLQITVTNRAVADGQNIWGREGFGEWFSEQVGVKDFYIGLRPSEEKDLKAQIERETMRVMLGGQIKQLGWEIDIYDGPDGLDFKIGEKLPMDMGMMGGGGMPGQGGGAPNWGGFRGGQRGSENRYPGDVGEVGTRSARTQGYQGQPEMPLAKAMTKYWDADIVKEVDFKAHLRRKNAEVLRDMCSFDVASVGQRFEY